ncbi:hypothetical protein GWI33_010242 [Rhynchophorus ferrugineus]|uniref:Odorant receptor n=1 Tax=Rhynchophorus ferrugineus TaxID=354439 RepID=A0A834IV73_RHYFE|nr:hypothetical protein GWI33_010242 [Rhynchophorus ferrugineus]
MRMTMLNCPKLNLFGRCVELFCLMGIMPDLPDGSNKSGWLYKIFSFLMYYSGCLFNMFEFVNLLQIFLSKKEGTLEMAITNYMLASLHLTGLLKCALSKGKIGAKYMQKVINFERKVYVSENKELITIYENNSKDFRKTAAGYFIGVFMVIVCYGSSSLIRSKQYVMIANITYETNQVPLQIWSPFNQYTQFILTYLWCLLIGAQLAFFFVAGDLVCFGYSIFALCRLKILKYFIMSFFEKAKEIRHQLNCDETESYRILQRECIIMHQEIISFVDSLNSHIKYIMLMDFLPGSIQLAALLYQLINNLNMIQMVLIGEFLLTLTVRFFIYCLNANKINEQSQMIGTVWYQIDWTVLPEDLKKNIFICVNRTQKPLSISMGDFQDISLVTFVSIMKGAYTYMMFLTTF